MHGLVIHIGRVSIDISPLVTVVLLLIHDVVLCVGNDTSILDTLDGLADGNTGQDWIGGETWL